VDYIFASYLYPRLFLVSSQKDKKVIDLGEWYGGRKVDLEVEVEKKFACAGRTSFMYSFVGLFDSIRPY
jgi:hypothetical protein